MLGTSHFKMLYESGMLKEEDVHQYLVSIDYRLQVLCGDKD